MNKRVVCCVSVLLLALVIAETGWAKGIITLPRTGQTRCYDAGGSEISCPGTGQDGEWQVGVEWADARFEEVSGDCVTDNLTGLMWSKNGNLPGTYMTWAEALHEALDYVASMNSGAGLCGYKDWRLPNINELETLINAGEDDPATWLNSQGFVNVQSFSYLSSTMSSWSSECSGRPVCPWAVHIWDGSVAWNDGQWVWPVRSGQSNIPDLSYSANVWKTGQTAKWATGDDGDLQRGVAWPAPRFTGPDGSVPITGAVVFDRLTGLMWAKNANLPGWISWKEALDYVKSLNAGAGLGGYWDWRLPNRKELFSLVDHSQSNPALPAGHPFQNVQIDDGAYCSSTTYSNVNTNNAWNIDMWDGSVVPYDKSEGSYVWPVRAGTGVNFTVSPAEGSIGTAMVLEGAGFGSKKGKVLVGGLAMKVTEWTPGRISLTISKVPASVGTYPVVIQPKEPKGAGVIAEIEGFTLKGPEIESLSANHGSLKQVTTINGKFFGSKKGKVYLEGKACKVTSWIVDQAGGKDEIKFQVPGGVTGTLQLQVINGVGSSNTVSFTVD